MALDALTPVLVGAGQITNRADRGEPVLQAYQLMAEALRRAVTDTTGRGVLPAIDSLRVAFSLSGAYRNGPLLVANDLGISPRHLALVLGGGEGPGAMVAGAAADIAAGRHDVIALATGEAWWSKVDADRTGRDLRWIRQGDDVALPEVIGEMIEFVHPAERALGVTDPIQQYPLFEQALRGQAGRTVEEHRRFLGELWAGFSEVATANPHAWDREGHDAEEISTPSRGNRLVGSPYTKLMVSNEQVDQGAAVLVTSAERAFALGIPTDRWVFPVAAVHGAAPPISERYDLHHSPLAEFVGRAITKQTGSSPAHADYVDLYSCFPSAVQLQAAGLRIGLDRQLTVTGGMRFAGGPWAGYAMHAVASMIERLRHAGDGATGLCCANGGAVTKLVALSLAAAPPSSPFSFSSVQARLDASPRRRVNPTFRGMARVESYTVMHGRGGDATSGILTCWTPDQQRAWGVVHGADDLAVMGAEDVLGAPVTIRADNEATFG